MANKIKPNIKKPHHFLATFGGIGLIPFAPGTFGSLASVLLGYGIFELTHSRWLLLVLCIGFFFTGIKSAQSTSDDLKRHDAGAIVIDEVAAEFLILACLPSYKITYFILTFVVFRIFDIIKPYPISYLDTRIRNGFGIMIDDIGAAIFSIVVIYLIYFI